MAVVTTGFFDGVHLGHRHLIRTLVDAARQAGDEAIVVSFWPHPRTVFQQDARDLRLLSTLEEKKAMLYGLGVDRIEILPFNRAFAALTAAAYLRDVLMDQLQARTLVVGYDNTVGSDRCSAEHLRPLCEGLGLNLLLCSRRAGDPISSTRIRAALQDGDVTGAAASLGYTYALKGVVIAGNRLGRTLGFPTANMQLYEPLKLVPGNGVYAVDVEVLGRNLRGMCNIGTRPTIGGTARTIETHIFDFDEEIYGLDIALRFLRRIRSERKFPSLEALKAQLEEDRSYCCSC